MAGLVLAILDRFFGCARSDARLSFEGDKRDDERTVPMARVWRREGRGTGPAPHRGGGFFARQGRSTSPTARHPGQIWTCALLEAPWHDGPACQICLVLDHFSGECLAIRPGRRLEARKIVNLLAELVSERGAPDRIDLVSERAEIADAVRAWSGRSAVTVGVTHGTGLSSMEDGGARAETFHLQRAEVRFAGSVNLLAEAWRSRLASESRAAASGMPAPLPEARGRDVV